MSSIGSSPGISTGQHIEVSGVRAVTGAEHQQQAAATPTTTGAPATAPTTAPTTGQTTATHSNTAASMVTSTALDAGRVPVDGERVSQIRKAIQTGSYPILPARISDAMIAAGIMLQVKK